ncbi:ASCH domain-containing protein [Flaviaesturariibacter amylovorans]|uniref:ASCH domain-containing protein n=1 Tax=Flaviaesturariibacter amylovorans TaxID=1084520 RepID=A0ABP8GNA8_9BACT
MKVLSLLQPWATLVVLGQKRIECRSWQTAHRGPLLIHASARKPTRREKFYFESAPYFGRFVPDMEHLPYGALIGQVTLVDIHSTEWLVPQHQHLFDDIHWPQELAFDDYSPGRFAWHLTDARELPAWLPVKGTLGLWEYNGSFE